MNKNNFCVYVFILIAAITLGCDKKTERQNKSTISVYGIGTVLAQPDMIQMSVTLHNVAQTTKNAQEAVSNMVGQVLALLKESSIEDKNITTASLTFGSEYEYANSRRVLIGQRAEQRITFSLDDINTDTEKVSRIIDKLIQINGIELNQIHFSVKDNTEYFIKSRELAFQKAVDKANQYAELSKRKRIKVLSITEEANQHISPIHNRLLVQSYNAEAAGDFGSTIVPAGELEITTKILVVFSLE